MDFGHLGHTVKSGLTGAVSDLVGGLWADTPGLTGGSPVQGPNAMPQHGEPPSELCWRPKPQDRETSPAAGRQLRRSLGERSTRGKSFSIHSHFGGYREAES